MGTDALTKAARRAMERMYIDTCKISVNVKTVDEKTHVTRQKWTVLAEDEPCRLSFLSFPANGESDTTDVMMQSVKIFLRPELVVPAGSRIDVTRSGRTVSYKRGGAVALYPTHQEIELTRAEEHP